MRLLVVLSIPVAAAIIVFWWWLGAPAATLASPVPAGAKLYCVSYSPFRGSQTPFDLSMRIDPRQIEDDLARLSAITDCVRTYSTDYGLDRVAEIAARHGMKAIQGVWLGYDAVRNRREIAAATALAKRFPDVVRAIVAGNEVLLRGEMSPSDLADTIRKLKAQVTVPVTYADVWEFWLRYREVYDAVDFVTIHILPYWEDFPVSAGQAAVHLQEITHKVAAAFPGKEVVIGEVGWPSGGRMREGALPSPINQARVVAEVLAVAQREHLRVNIIEAFDQPWKRGSEGTVGGHWGLLDGVSRMPKFMLGAPISNHPHWRLQAVGGVALAAVIFGAAVAARKREPLINEPMTARWAGVAGIALSSGALLGWTIENLPVESLGVGGWAKSSVMAVLAIMTPVMCAAALTRRAGLPSFAQVLGPRARQPKDRLVRWLGLSFAIACVVSLEVALGLVFDPRDRDFPFAPLTAATVPFLTLMLVGGGRDSERGLSETVMAAAFAGSAVYVALNEGFNNWEALWMCAVFLALSVTLLRARVVPS
jgi:exo-beta-1,3-glucanase (GH17 family)